MSYGNNITNAQLPVPRMAEMPVDPITLEKSQGYQVIRLRLPQYIDSDSVRSNVRHSVPIKISGDTIHVLEITGPHLTGLAVNKGKDFLPIRQGDTITRPFTEFRCKVFCGVTDSGAGLLTPNDQERDNDAVITLLISYGKVIERPVRRPGFHAGSPKARGTATTLGVRLFSMFENGGLHRIPIQTCKLGGTVLIRNRSMGESLFLYDGQGGDFAPAGTGPRSPESAWEILPGEIFTLEAETTLSAYSNHLFLVGTGPCLGTLLGDVPYTVMASTFGDASDPDAVAKLNAQSRTLVATDLSYTGKP